MPTPQSGQHPEPRVGSIYDHDGVRVRLVRQHSQDVNIWISVPVDNDQQRGFIGRPWIIAHAPIALGPDVVGGEATVTPPLSVSNQPPEPEEMTQAEAETPVRRPRQPRAVVPPVVVPAQPVCPGCSQTYTGVLGERHVCDSVLERRCVACHGVNMASFAVVVPPAYPHLCPSCVTGGVKVCRQCGNSFSGTSRSLTAIVCNVCTPLMDGNIWLGMPSNRAYGNNIRVEVPSLRSFAVEVECYCMPGEVQEPYSSPGPNWIKKTDGSIRPESGSTGGAEFVSPPYFGDGGLAMLNTAVKKIRNMGYRANKSCGLHVHVDALDFKTAEFEALNRFGLWIQNDVYKLVAPSRSGNHFCQEINNRVEASERYRWMNMKPAWDRHRTVEFRLHHGVTNPERVYEWVKVCLSIVERGLRYGHLPTKPNLQFFDLLGLSKFQQDYWKSVAHGLHRGQVITFDGREL